VKLCLRVTGLYKLLCFCVAWCGFVEISCVFVTLLDSRPRMEHMYHAMRVWEWEFQWTCPHWPSTVSVALVSSLLWAASMYVHHSWDKIQFGKFIEGICYCMHQVTWYTTGTKLLGIVHQTTRTVSVLNVIHCVPPPKKTCDFIFYINFNNKCPITIIFGIISSKSMSHRKMVSFPTLGHRVFLYQH